MTPLLLLALGCAPAKLLRLENEVLKNQLAELETQIQSCEREAPPPGLRSARHHRGHP